MYIIKSFKYLLSSDSNWNKFLFCGTLLFAIIVFCASFAGAQDKRILFIAGPPSHGFGNHEHLGGSKLLARTINNADIGIKAEVSNGWPENTQIFDNVDAVVILSNGGPNQHPLVDKLEEFRKVMDRNVGLVNVHYAVEIPKGEGGNAFLEWVGGYFETHWSVNPFWTARFETFPDHPVTNGVKPFEALDEWYYHMRFTDDMKNVTPVLTDLPPEHSLSRDDGPHSNNANVRDAVLERQEPQHVAWAYERPDGGRGFGFTGAHYHWNWGIDEFRRLVANAIVWAAGVEVPAEGIRVEPITILELAELTDDEMPARWPYRIVQYKLDRINGRTTGLD